MDKSLQLKIITRLQDKLSGPLKSIMGASKGSSKELKDLRDKLKGLEQTQKQVGQFREMHTGLQRTSGELEKAQSKVNDLARRMQAASTPSKALTKEFNQATASAKSLRQSHEQQSVKLQGLRDKLHGAGVSTKDLNKDNRQLKERITSANQALEDQKNKLASVAEQQRKLTAAREKYDKTLSTASNLAVSGAAGYMGGRRVLTGMAGFMGEGANFDKEMSKVQALTRLDKNSEQLQALRDQARELGATTAFTSTDAAAGQAFLGMAGFTPEAIKAAMPGVLDMALAGDMDLATTADISSNILTGMGLQADQMGRVADVMTGAFTRSNTDIRMLGDTMKYAAPVAAQFGIDLETTTAMAAKLGDAGIQGSMGGTAIRRIIGRLAAPNKAARDAMEQLGVQVADSEGKMRPITDLLAEIYEKSSKLSEIEQGQIYKAIGGEQGVAAMGVLAEQAGTGKLQELQQDLYESAGEAAANAATRIDNALGDIEILKSAWADVSIELFSQNNSAIREVIQTITEYISIAGKWARENPVLVSTIVKIVAVVAALAVGLGGIAITIAGILGPFAMLRYGMTLFGIHGGGLISIMGKLGSRILPLVGKGILFIGRALLMNPIGLAIMAIAGAAYLIYKYWEPIKQFFADIWSQVKTAFDGGIAGVSALIINWSPLGLFYKAFAGVMNYLGVELPDKFTGFGSMIIQGLVNGIKNMGSAVKEAVVNVGSSTVGWFKEKLGIESPSRVFMGLGGYVSEGAALGINKRRPLAEKAAKLMAIGVMSAGVMTPAAASIGNVPEIKFDKRPAISAMAKADLNGRGNNHNDLSYQAGGDHIEIKIYPPSGADPHDIARAVAQELDRRDREKMARRRSSLMDYGN